MTVYQRDKGPKCEACDGVGSVRIECEGCTGTGIQQSDEGVTDEVLARAYAAYMAVPYSRSVKEYLRAALESVWPWTEGQR